MDLLPNKPLTEWLISLNEETLKRDRFPNSTLEISIFVMLWVLFICCRWLGASRVDDRSILSTLKIEPSLKCLVCWMKFGVVRPCLLSLAILCIFCWTCWCKLWSVERFSLKRLIWCDALQRELYYTWSSCCQSERSSRQVSSDSFKLAWCSLAISNFCRSSCSSQGKRSKFSLERCE